MHKKILLSGVSLLVCASCVYASGYRIPEQSLAATAKSGANTASTNGADASYYNPANMSFLDNKSYLQLDLTYINLPTIKYKDAQNPLLNSSSTVEHFLAPTFHYVSPEIAEDLRFGVSLTAPGGLAKRWDDFYAKTTAEKFALKILELSPSLAYKVNDQLSFAFGPRMTYISGEVKSDGSPRIHPGEPASPTNPRIHLKRDLEGDSIDFGYNLAVTLKPSSALTLAATYRSKVDLTVEGDAELLGVVENIPRNPLDNYKGDASITIPLPAVLNLAVSYDFGKTIVEAVYERTFWSSYKELDFDYSRDLTENRLLANFDKPLPRDWSDVNAYRIGITHEATDKLTLMAGFAYDKSPAKKDLYFGFELPDSDARLYSLGASYAISKDMKVGLSYLYDQKEKRTVNIRTLEDITAINGTFKDASAHLVTLSFSYEF